MITRRAVLALCTLVPAGACYSYHAVRVDELRPEVAVRVRLTAEQAARVSAILGYQAGAVEGRVASVRADTLLLTLPTQTAVAGASVQRFYQRVDVPVAAAVELDQRRLNRPGTYALIASAALGAGALVAWTFSAIGSRSGGDKGGTHNLLLPLGRLIP